ncbi:MAG: glycosyltransferase [Bacteroidota bacterium]|nr:glycosyltransferase [Bacteroidota bacterium]
MESNIKIALVHDWLTGMRGGEKVLEVLCEMFPDATLFTLLHNKGSVSPTIENMKIRTSIIQHLPNSMSRYQYYLPLMPFAIERFDMNEYDLIISSSHAVAKGVRVRKNAIHICYCHTPMRYIWDQYENYFSKTQSGLATRTAMGLFRRYLQQWDVKSSSRVNYFIANSKNVQERILRIYNRESEVIYPPVETSRFKISQNEGEYFLIVSALVPYKRIDIAVDAFNEIGEKLVIVGVGSELEKLKKSAMPNIEFQGWASDGVIADYYSKCRALIFPGEEDFGIVPLEAMASGKPVIAYAKGGTLETVVENRTGIFFQHQCKESLIDAAKRFDTKKFNAEEIHRHALEFDRKIFKEKIQTYTEKVLSKQQ